MKRNFFLTAMLSLLCITTGWAQGLADGVYTIAGDENLTRGYMCAGEGYSTYPVLTEITYSGYTGNSVAAVVNGKNWYVATKVEGTYIYNLGLDKYLVKDNGNINFGDTPYAWTIMDNGNFKAIYDAALGKYLSMGCSRGPADRPIAWDTNANDGGAMHTFTAVENGATTFATQIANVEADLATLIDTDPYVLLKAPTTGNYLSVTASGNTAISFQTTGTKLLLENSSEGTGYYIRIKDVEPATYISKSGSNTWDVTTSTTAYTWLFSEPDNDGYVTISHVNGNLGHDGNQNAGTGIFANVGGDCNKWLIEEYNAGAVEYTFQITNPTGEDVSATYKGNAITADETIEIEGMVDTSLFDATDVEGYTWGVVVDSGAKTITIVYVEIYNGSYYLKTSSGTYLNFTPHASLSTAVTFQATGSELYIEPSGDNYYITQLNSTPVKYLTVSSDNAWDVAASTAAFAWSISIPDANGYVTIKKASNSDHRLGNDGNQNAGTGVFANVGVNCNKWQLVKVGPLDYTFAINNPTGEAVSATYNGNAITAGATISIDGRVDTSLFSANEIEGYAWSVELDPDTRTITLVYEKKYNWSIVDLPDGATITYNSAAVTDGGIVGVDYDSQYLAVTCPNGYTWAVTRDNENKIVTITFTQLQSAENPQAVVDLLNRIGGAGTADKFKIVLDPSLNYTAEQFSINGEDGKILIKGTTISAITTGIGWYLQNHAHINIAWNSLNEKTVSGDAYADLSNIPVPTAEEIHTSDAMYRYYLNTCAFGYSMTSWTWKRWQQEIDWMALHGINMPLQLVGMEEVWRKFLTMEDGSGNRKYGYSDADAKAFVAGPAFIAWWAMNNLQGWGGTAAGTKSGGTWDGAGGVQDDAWYVRQKNLAKLICDRQRELGMQPVIPGWSGMVPTNFASKSTYATRGNGGNWAGDFVRPLLLSVSNANYAEIAADYYTCLHEVMGESQYYSMDPFHEGGGAGTMEDYEAMYAAMEAAMPGSKWVIQQWQWSSTQRYSLTAVPAGRLVVLDLFADGSPAFDSYNGYAPQDAVFSTIPNFGGRSGLMGRLTNLTDNYFLYKGKYSSIKGVGAAPEAIEQTPVTYDLIFQLPWMNGVKPDVAEWVSNYSIARYGVENEEIQEAWSLLRQGPLNYGADAIQGPVEDVWAAKPNLTAKAASYWGKTMNNAIGTYTKARHQMLIDATYKLISQSSVIAPGTIYESNYNYDLVEFGGGVLADYAYYLLLGINEAKTASNSALYEARRDAFLQLILDVDAFKGTNLNFRLGKWTQEARDAAGEVTGATTATADWYEYNNARTIVSTWSSPATNLNDYSYRSWQGLMKDLYYPRWKHYFDNNCTSANYDYFAWNWAHGKEHNVGQTAVSNVALTAGQQGHTDTYTREPVGNTVEKATEVLGKYIIPVKLADGSTYYAYRCLSNDLNLTLNTTQGATLDLSEYITFGNTDGVTMSITSSLIDGTSTDLSAVAIKADACGGADSATDVVTVALSDGTSLTLTVVVETSELATAKENLAALIEEMEGLAAQVGTYNPVGVLNEVTLTTTQGSNGYIWTNAQSSQEGPIAGLIDTDLSTYLHTDYTSSVTSGTHYIAIDLGEDYELGKFTIDYTTRSGAQSDFPDGIVVYGSDTNGDDYVKIAEITEPTFPQSGNKKWELGKNLYSNKRYLRFNVLAKRGYWHMADFNIYKTASTAEVVNEYSTVIDNEFAATQYDVLVDAKNTYDYGETTQETTDAVTALQAAIDALKKKMAESPELTALIEDFGTLIADIADIETSESNTIPLQVSDAAVEGYIYSNATIAEGNLDDLLDDDNESYIHTTWSGNTADGKNHYLRVYLGENPSLSNFTFSYVTRNNVNTEKPKQITVAGCATIDGEYTTIATITDLPSASATTFTSDTYDATGYKYLRFMVDDTYRDLTDGNGHKAYSMAKLVITDLVNTHITVNVTFKDASYKTLRGITDTEIVADYKALQAAIAINESGTADEKETAYQSLKAVYDALNAKLQYMDEGVYTINYISNSTETPVFVGYSTDTSGNNNTAGYKLIDPTSEHISEVAQADKLFTITHNGAGYALSAQNKYLENPHTDGWHHITFSDDEAAAGRYMFEEVETDVYKLFSDVANNQQANYVNDYGNVFGNDKKGKASSTFTLTKVENYTLTVPEGGVTTLCLPFNVVLPTGVTAYDIVETGVVQDGTDYKYEFTQLATVGATLAKGTPVIIKATAGDYPLVITMNGEGAVGPATGSVLCSGMVKTTIGTNEFNYVLNVVDGVATFSYVSSTQDVAANNCWLSFADKKGDVIYEEIPEAELPVVGKVYRIRSYISNTADGNKNHYLVNSNVAIDLPAEVEDDDKSAMWICVDDADDKFKFVSALGTAALGWKVATEAAAAFTISPGVVNGAIKLSYDDNYLAVEVDNNNKAAISQATTVTQGVDFSTDWFVELVDDAAVTFTKSIRSGNNFATLYLPYNVTVPDGVMAYTATAENVDEKEAKVISLVEVNNSIIPANTAVILHRENNENTGNFVFEYTADEVDSVDGNIFGGRITTGYVGGEDGKNFYLLLNSKNGEALYKMYKEYDQNGTHVGENNGGYIKCEANKGYMKLDAGKASSYSFRFDGSTGIEEVNGENGNVKAIYDLQGRKLLKTGKPGIYIIDGKKVYVK